MSIDLIPEPVEAFAETQLGHSLLFLGGVALVVAGAVALTRVGLQRIGVIK